MSKNALSLEAFTDWCWGKTGVYSAYDETGNAGASYYKTLGLKFEYDYNVDAYERFNKKWSVATKITWAMKRVSYDGCGGLTSYARLASFLGAHAS